MAQPCRSLWHLPAAGVEGRPCHRPAIAGLQPTRHGSHASGWHHTRQDASAISPQQTQSRTYAGMPHSMHDGAHSSIPQHVQSRPDASGLTAHTPRQLTASLSSSQSIGQLVRLLQAHHEMLNPVHISAALVRAARLRELRQHPASTASPQGLSPPSDLHELVELCGALLLGDASFMQFNGQLPGSYAPLHDVKAGQSVAAPAEGLLGACGVRELANVCWALVKLEVGQHLAPALLQALQDTATRPAIASQHQQRQRHQQQQLQHSQHARLPLATPAEGFSASPAAGAGWLDSSTGTRHVAGAAPWLGGRPALPLRAERKLQSELATATSQALVNLLWACAHWYKGCYTGVQGLKRGTTRNFGEDSGGAAEGGSRRGSGAAVAADAGGWQVVPARQGPQREAGVIPGGRPPPGGHWHSQNQSASGLQEDRGQGASAKGTPGSSAFTAPSQLTPVLEALCAALLRVLDSASPQDLALATWSLGMLGYTPQGCGLLPALLSVLPGSCSQQTPQGLGSLAWGCARLLPAGQVPAELQQALEQRAVLLAGQLAARPQDTAVLVSSLVALGHSSPRVWRVLQAQVATAGLAGWPPSCLAALLSAYANARRPCPQLLAALHQHLVICNQLGRVPAQPTQKAADVRQAEHLSGLTRTQPGNDSGGHEQRHTMQNSLKELGARDRAGQRQQLVTDEWRTRDLVRLMWALARLGVSEQLAMRTGQLSRLTAVDTGRQLLGNGLEEPEAAGQDLAPDTPPYPPASGNLQAGTGDVLETAQSDLLILAGLSEADDGVNLNMQSQPGRIDGSGSVLSRCQVDQHVEQAGSLVTYGSAQLQPPSSQSSGQFDGQPAAGAVDQPHLLAPPGRSQHPYKAEQQPAPVQVARHASPCQLRRELVSVLANAVMVRVEAGDVEPTGVALAAWAVASCGVPDAASLLLPCVRHAATHLHSYTGSEVAIMLRAHQVLTSQPQLHSGSDDLPLLGSSSSTLPLTGHAERWQAMASVSAGSDGFSDEHGLRVYDAAWDSLWGEVAVNARRVLPSLGQNELVALCVAAVAVGRSDRRLFGGALELMLGAVAKRARRLQQQQLARAAAELFASPVQLVPAGSTGNTLADGISIEVDVDKAQSQHQPVHAKEDQVGIAADVGDQLPAGPPPHSQELDNQDYSAHHTHLGAESRQVQSQQAQRSKPYQHTAPDNSLSRQASPSRHMPTLVTAMTLMWALARAGYRNARLFQLLVTLSLGDRGASRLSPQQLHRLLWACICSGAYSKPLFQELCLRLGLHLGSFEPVHLSACLCLLSASRHYDAHLLAGVCVHLRGRMHRLDAEQLACLMWGMANVNAGVMVQWRAPLDLLRRRIPDMSRHAVVLLLWAVAVQQHVLLGGIPRAPQSHARLQRPPIDMPQTNTPEPRMGIQPRVTLPQSSLQTHPAVPQSPAQPAEGTKQPTAVQPDAVTVGESVGQPPVPLASRSHASRAATVGCDGLEVLNALLDRLETDLETETTEPTVSDGSWALLGQALSLLLCSTRPAVRQALADSLTRCQPDAIARVRAAWLSTRAGNHQVDVSRSPLPVGLDADQGLGLLPRTPQHRQPQALNGDQVSGVAWCIQRSTIWYAIPPGLTVVGEARRQLAQAMQRLGFAVQLTDRLMPPPLPFARSSTRTAHTSTATAQGADGLRPASVQAPPGVDGSPGEQDGSKSQLAAARKAFPALSDGLLLLPHALPVPLAVVVAPPVWFARNAHSEALGPLFTVLTLLGDMGWRAAVLDARGWDALQGRGQKLRFVRALLVSWKVTLPEQQEEAEDSEDE